MILSKLDVNKINFSNHYKVEDAIQRTVFIFVSYPFTYCRILIQLGYEPFRPILVDTLFGGSRYAYPSVFKYINYIQTEDGLIGLFRGSGHRLCAELTREFLDTNTLDVCKQIDQLINEETDKKKKPKKDDESDDEEDKTDGNEEKSASFDKESVLKLIRRLICKTVSKTVSLTISYPLHVCFIRGCSQFIGREKIYNFSPFNIPEIIRQGKLYDGFAPKLLAELLILWVSSTMIFTVDALIDPDRLLLNYLSTFINFFVSSTVYPLQLTSTIMSVNHSKCLLASKIEPPFYSWRTCYDSLERRNQLKRGSALIWRYVANAYKPQAIIRPYMDDE